MKTQSLRNKIALLLIFVILPMYFINAQGSIPTDKAMQAGITSSSIPNFDNGNFYKSNFHSRGFQWALYSLKCPLAWEITKGQDGTFGQEIFIGAKEGLLDTVEHPDMATNFTLISNRFGNNTQNIRKRTIGDSPTNYRTEYLRDNHGLLTLSCAISGENNGSNAPIVGTAPRCLGFYTGGWSYSYDSLDVDGRHDNRITPVDVTYQAASYNHRYNILIHKGIVSFVSAGNSITQSNGGTTLPIFDPATNKTTTYRYPRPPFNRDINSFYDARYPNDVSKSIKPITISGMVDGDLYDQWCEPWTTGPYVGPVYKGAERFCARYFPTHPSLNFCFTFSRGYEKFSNDITKRNDAFVDLTVPAFSILSAAENLSDPKAPDRLYQDGAGTSQGSAMAAGVGALMRSVSKYLLAPIDNNVNSPNYRMPLYGQDVHKSAYDILTFTADKVPDGGVMPDTINGVPVAQKYAVWDSTNRRYEFGEGYKYDYATQTNDKLRRSWAIRMGFGKINAYRAVAHSIRNKGEYEYILQPGNNSMETMFKYADSTGDTRGYQVDGKRVLHFGSKVKEGDMYWPFGYILGYYELPTQYGPTSGNDGILNVLEWGGVSIPGESHNNQGVTRIVTSGTSKANLVVPPNCTLVIDGILHSGNYMSHSITATDPSSKILMEGYIDGITLCGNLKVGDLKIGGGIMTTVLNFTGNSDLYGKISSLFTGISLSDSGTLTIHPGAEIRLATHFTGNSVATFKSGTGVYSNGQLDVTGGAKIIIDDSATVNFDCVLMLDENATMILKPGAVLHLRQLAARAGSTITMYGGSMLFLDCDSTHVAGKIIAINSSPSNPIHLRSKMIPNCYDPTASEFLHSYSSCYANLKYQYLTSYLGPADIRNVNLIRYKSTDYDTDLMYETSIVSIEPNPTSSDANITYSIAESGLLSITLCNTLGQEVLEIHNAFQNTGIYTKPFSTSGLPKGIYFMKMLIGSETKVKKIIVN